MILRNLYQDKWHRCLDPAILHNVNRDDIIALFCENKLDISIRYPVWQSYDNRSQPFLVGKAVCVVLFALVSERPREAVVIIRRLRVDGDALPR